MNERLEGKTPAEGRARKSMFKKIRKFYKSKLDLNTEKYGQRSTNFLESSIIFWLTVIVGLSARLVASFFGY